MKATNFETQSTKELNKFIAASQKRIHKGERAVEKSGDFLVLLSKHVERILDSLSAWIIAISAGHHAYEEKTQTETTELAESVLSFTDTIEKLKG